MKLQSFFQAAGSAALVASVALFFQLRQARNETAALKAALESRPGPTISPEPIELADVMEKLQRHSNKLYFSGKLENWPLAAFYLEELEEVVESIADRHVMEGQINISGLMQGLILPEVEKLESAVKAKDRDGFLQRYQALTASCNACHVASNHPFIVIQEPHAPFMDNQRYSSSVQ